MTVTDSFFFLFPQAACHKERHVSQKAVSFIHDVLIEVLSSWAELSHFHFNEALFRPFEHIMQLELCDEDVQDQVCHSHLSCGQTEGWFKQSLVQTNLSQCHVFVLCSKLIMLSCASVCSGTGDNIHWRAGGDVLGSDPVWLEAAVQCSPDRAWKQNGYEGLPDRRILYGSVKFAVLLEYFSL